jgi:hypothetical protein
MRSETPTGRTGGITSRGRILPGRKFTPTMARTVWNTTVNIVPIVIPPDESPPLNNADYAAIFPGCVVTVAGNVNGPRLGYAMGAAFERGAGAIAVACSNRDGVSKIIVWSGLPQYKVGAVFSIDLKA